MKFLILFALSAVTLAAVKAAPQPIDDYSDNNYQQKNVKVIIERQKPEIRKIIVEKRVPIVQQVIVERRIPTVQKVIVEKQIPVIKKIVEVREPRKIVVVKRPSYDEKDSLSGYEGGYGQF